MFVHDLFSCVYKGKATAYEVMQILMYRNAAVCDKLVEEGMCEFPCSLLKSLSVIRWFTSLSNSQTREDVSSALMLPLIPLTAVDLIDRGLPKARTSLKCSMIHALTSAVAFSFNTHAAVAQLGLVQQMVSFCRPDFRGGTRVRAKSISKIFEFRLLPAGKCRLRRFASPP